MSWQVYQLQGFLQIPKNRLESRNTPMSKTQRFHRFQATKDINFFITYLFKGLFLQEAGTPTENKSVTDQRQCSVLSVLATLELIQPFLISLPLPSQGNPPLIFHSSSSQKYNLPFCFSLPPPIQCNLSFYFSLPSPSQGDHPVVFLFLFLQSS